MLRKINRILLGAVMLFLSFATPVYAIPRPDVSAECAALYCPLTGEFLYGKNASRRQPPASTTKIMTSLLTCESGILAQTVTVSQNTADIEGSSMGLRAGDSVTVRGLLYGMLLTSGNDAANAAAEAIDGSCEAFVGRMNVRASAMGLRDTHFSNPSGLPADGHYTTARDLALLTAQALKNELFAAVCSLENAEVVYGNPPYRRTLSNHNRLLSEYDGCIGVKTGYTKAAGRCLVSAAKRNGVTLICVTLNDPDDWADHRALLDYGFSSVRTRLFVPDTRDVSVPVTGGSRKSVSVRCVRGTAVGADSAVRTELLLPPFVYAPVRKGDIIGYAAVYCGGEQLEKLPLLADCDALPSESGPAHEGRTRKTNLFDRILKGIAFWKKK
ncbi:MAG: D-alanyl-D-alanine carboxypeptidase [Clostridia bacterium]|nr:D-alanyl-D-alanine carboxypeptidase [Clostridia bacterium]